MDEASSTIRSHSVAKYFCSVGLDVPTDSCRWEQAFSDDGGKAWETNWIMEMKREKEDTRQSDRLS